MTIKIFLFLGIISNLIVNSNSVGAYFQSSGIVFSPIYIYLINILKIFITCLVIVKVPILKNIPTLFKYLICFEVFIFIHGVFSNTGYYQIKNSVLYFLPQIICLPLAFIYYKQISRNIQFITKVSICILISSLILGISDLAIQKTFSYVYILGIIHFLRSEYKYLFISLLFCSILCSLGLESRMTFIRLLSLLLIIAGYFFLKLEGLKRYSKRLAIISVFGFMFLLFNLYSNEGRINLQEMVRGDFNLTSDTRSLVYYNVISSTNSTKDILVGRGASANYETHFYNAGGTLGSYRFRNEVDILNKYLYGGIVYILIFIVSVIYERNGFRKTLKKEIIGIFLVSFVFLCFLENTSEYSTLWLLFWFLALTHKNVRLRFTNSYT